VESGQHWSIHGALLCCGSEKQEGEQTRSDTRQIVQDIDYRCADAEVGSSSCFCIFRLVVSVDLEGDEEDFEATVKISS
jgi:hypothetical protein